MPNDRRRTDILNAVRIGMAGMVWTCVSAQAAYAQIGAPSSVTTAAPGADGKSVVTRNVMVPMRDGTRLATDVHLPSRDGLTPLPGPHPVLLLRTPYNKTFFAFGFPGNLGAKAANAAGYAVVIQDVRGSAPSEGVLEPMMNEAPDGVYTLRWIRQQSWSNGRIGTLGGSYNGGVQMLMAAQGPAGLVTSFSEVAATSQFTNEWVYMDGILTATSIQWTLQMLQGFQPKMSAAQTEQLAADRAALGIKKSTPMPEAFKALALKLPLIDLPVVRNAPWWTRWLNARDDRDYFKPNEMGGRYKGIKVPIYHVGGWYDLFLRNSLQHYVGASTGAGSAAARRGQRLMIGPWSHTSCTGCALNAAVDRSALALGWMNHMFKERIDPVFDHPVVLYVMGENRWRSESAWPLADTRRTRYYLHSGGSANTASGDGTLSTSAPAAESPDHYAYDPRNPAPTAGGPGLDGSRATQNEVETRKDVLVFSTPALTQDVEVTGNISATLFAASSATDTDWWVKLIDVDADGKAMITNHGVVRARYRTSRTQPKALRPGAIEKYRVDLWATSNVFKKGHRIRVEVTSSNYPYADRNPNSFVDLNKATEKDFVVAQQRVYHDAAHPSFVDLPVIPLAHARNWIETPYPQKSVAVAPK